MHYTFGIYGEYEDYVCLNLTEVEFNAIKKFIDEVNSNDVNIRIEVLKKEN